MSYQSAQTELRAARAESSAAGLRVELCSIRARLAELQDQHEPLASECGDRSEGYDEKRRLMYRAAFYAVIGRWPDDG